MQEVILFRKVLDAQIYITLPQMHEMHAARLPDPAKTCKPLQKDHPHPQGVCFSISLVPWPIRNRYAVGSEEGSHTNIVREWNKIDRPVRSNHRWLGALFGWQVRIKNWSSSNPEESDGMTWSTDQQSTYYRTSYHVVCSKLRHHIHIALDDWLAVKYGINIVLLVVRYVVRYLLPYPTGTWWYIQTFILLD